MTHILFFEKPGCRSNQRQKELLIDAGCRVEAKNLLAEPWTPDRLRPFFGRLPTAHWFNRSSPRVKSGAVVPERLGAEAALAAMIADPLLIRRPLMVIDGAPTVGFGRQELGARIPRFASVARSAPEGCSQEGKGEGRTVECPMPVEMASTTSFETSVTPIETPVKTSIQTSIQTPTQTNPPTGKRERSAP